MGNRCPLCGSSARVLYSDVEDYFFHTSGKWDICQCARIGCGVVFPSPYPNDDVLALAYGRYYTHDAVNGSFIVRGVKDLFFRCVSEVVEPCTAGISAVRWPLLGWMVEESILSFGAMRPLRGGTIADIGCGSGDRLTRLLNVGWHRAIGVDPDPRAVGVGRAKGREINQGSAERLPLPSESMDAILMHHVIEHVRYPRAALGEARRVLKPGGRLALLTPNAGSATHSQHGRFWRGIEAPRHLTIYTMDALISVVVEAGFEIECSRSSARSAAWSDLESGRVNPDIVTHQASGKFASMRRADAAFRRLTASIQGGLQIGDELVVVARRA